MSDNRHYERLTARPEKESRYAFLLTCFAITDVEPKPPLWLRPVEMTHDMAPQVKAYWTRWNQILGAYGTALRKYAIEALRLGGMPEAKLITPLNAKVEKLVRELTNGYRQELRSLEERRTADVLKRDTPIDDEGRFSRELCARVITATDEALGSPGYAAVAEYLNEGLPRGKGSMGLDRHHIRRAFDGRNKMLERLIRAAWRSRLVTPETLATLMFADFELVCHLDHVCRKAQARPEFKTRRGVDLALAIHVQYDLNEVVHRAAALPRVKRIAA